MGLMDHRLDQIYRNEPSLLHLMTSTTSTQKNLETDKNDTTSREVDSTSATADYKSQIDLKTRLSVHDSVLEWFM